jgi:pSer/pThr/pTyr-binding forkhead associated (FHA) protein
MSDTAVDPFLEACGTTEAIRLVVEIDGQVNDFRFPRPFVLIGRDPAADLHFRDKRLAMRHAYLQLVAGRLLFVDFQAKNGDQRARWLDPGHSVDLGPARIRVHEATTIASWVTSHHPNPYFTTALPAISLDVFGRGLRAAWRMKQPVELVGHSSGCKIRLTDSEVSTFHCALVKTPRGLWVVDLLSTRGLTVNGARVRVSRLDHGDLLRIGSFSICPRNERESSSGNSALPNNPAASLGIPAASPSSVTLNGLDVQSQGTSAPVNSLMSALPTDRRLDTESAVSPLVIQLAQMQQQMFAHMQQQMADQFQQSMSLFVDAFWAMHREQSEQTRKELKRIRRLTRELTRLQAELAKFGPASMPQPDQAVKLPERPAALPSRSEPVGLNSKATRPPSPSGEKIPEAPQSSATPTAPIFQKPGAQSPADMHAWLSARVTQIQRERQSSWQRLMSLFQAKPGFGDQGTAKTDSPKSAP